MASTNNTTCGGVDATQSCNFSWLLIPGETQWPESLRGILYAIAILYIFLGIAIAADIFMLSIEIITSKKRIIFTFDYETKQRVQKEVFVWNETIANLTLMALGSSAPEILIAVIETVTELDETMPKDGLGIFTIVGSASYNLLVISAVCVITVPSPTNKRISEFGVFVVTSIWSLLAYIWVMVVLKWSSENVVEIWEAVLTLAFFPLLVMTAWGQDRGWWILYCKRKRNTARRNIASVVSTRSSGHTVDVQSINPSIHIMKKASVASQSNGMSSSGLVRKMTDNRSKLRDIVSYVKEQENTENITAEDVVIGLKSHFDSTMSKAFARARFRHAVVVSITGNKKSNTCPQKSKLIAKAVESDDKKENGIELPYIIEKNRDHGYFCFSSSTYSASKSLRFIKIDVLYNRKTRSAGAAAKNVGFSHVVQSATKLQQLAEESSSAVVSTQHGGTCNGDSTTQLAEVYDCSDEDIENFNEMINQESGLRETGNEPHDSTPNIKNNNLIFKSKLEMSISNRSYEELKEKEEVPHITIRAPSTGSIYSDDVSGGARENGGFVKNGVSMVCYETREGSAKHEKDFIASSGTLIFTEWEYHKSIVIPIVHNKIDDGLPKDFYILLKTPCVDTCLGEPSIAHVTLVDDNEPGEFMFEEPTYHIEYSSQGLATASAKVTRLHGSDGKATVYYRTINGTAYGGNIDEVCTGKCDFEHSEKGALKFGSGETSKNIIIQINANAEQGKTFIIVLSHVTGSAAKIGHRSAAIISLTSEVDEIVDQVTSIMDKQEKDGSLTLMQMWKQQFIESMVLDGTPTCTAMILHFLCFFWKILLAFIPPRNLLGGWPTFVISLGVLGLQSAFVEQFAKLLGCVIGLRVSVTGITLVALGTSMPDTFASMTAASHDDTADAAIGNVTGSNCVNVFLGLGLPWVVKSVYLHYTKGVPMRVRGGNVLFAVVLFLICGVLSLSILVLRRIFCKGELGGGMVSKWISGIIMIALWLVFVVLSSLNSYNIISFFGSSC